MEYTTTSPFQQVLDLVELMSFEDQASFIEVLNHRLTDYRREEIARNAAMTLQAIRDREAQYGSIEDLKRDMLKDA
jgi:hypothetical protein